MGGKVWTSLYSVASFDASLILCLSVSPYSIDVDIVTYALVKPSSIPNCSFPNIALVRFVLLLTKSERGGSEEDGPGTSSEGADEMDVAILEVYVYEKSG